MWVIVNAFALALPLFVEIKVCAPEVGQRNESPDERPCAIDAGGFCLTSGFAGHACVKKSHPDNQADSSGPNMPSMWQL
jgi:hypothetical protein